MDAVCCRPGRHWSPDQDGQWQGGAQQRDWGHRPLVTSLTCTTLAIITNVELDEEATSSRVRGLQYGVERLVLYTRARLHLQWSRMGGTGS